MSTYQLGITGSALQTLIDDTSNQAHATASLDASSNTTMTNATDWYLIQGAFTNDFEDFELDTDKIKYIGTETYSFEIDWHAKLASDTVAATVNITVSINGTPTESNKQGIYLKTAGEPGAVSGTEVVELSTNDTIQLVIQTDKAGSVITVGQFNTTCTKYFPTRVV